MSDITTHRRVPYSPASLGLLGLLGLLVLLLLCPSCQSATQRQQRFETIEAEKQQKKAEQVAELRKARKEKLEKLLAIQRDGTRLKLAAERSEQLNMAWSALTQGNPAQAASTAEHLLSPESMVTTISYPDLDEKGEEIEATEELSIEITDAERAKLYDLQGTALFKLDQPDEAIEAFQAALEIQPDLRQARRNLGMLYFRAKRWKDCLDMWSTEMAYRDPNVMMLIGEAHFRLSKKTGDKARLKSARIAFESVLVQRPHDVKVHNWLATIEFELGRLDGAIEHFDAILAQNPLDTKWLELKARSLRQLERNEEAADAYELLYGVDPLPKYCRTLSALYGSLRQPALSAQWLIKTYGDLDRSAIPPNERLQIGHLFSESARNKEAIDWFESLQQGDDEFAEAQSRIAFLHRSEGRLDKALEAWEKLRGVEPEDCFAHLAAGDIYLEQQELESARDAYTTAAGYADCKADGFAGLAEVYYFMNNLDQAITEYEKALEQDPDSQRFRAALREIQAEREFARRAEEVSKQ